MGQAGCKRAHVGINNVAAVPLDRIGCNETRKTALSQRLARRMSKTKQQRNLRTPATLQKINSINLRGQQPTLLRVPGGGVFVSAAMKIGSDVTGPNSSLSSQSDGVCAAGRPAPSCSTTTESAAGHTGGTEQHRLSLDATQCKKNTHIQIYTHNPPYPN